MEKILVTTELKELQHAKIDALGIREDFSNIYIDDPRTNPRVEKLEIFKSILEMRGLQATETCVIGDNPESEIKAAFTLGMHTI